MRTGVNTLALLGAAAFAAMAPILFSASSVPAPQTAAFPGWPRHYESRPLTPLKLSQREQVFVQGFPGEVGRFSDGSREIIVRWVESPTRRLHPAADCFRGVGYTITPLQVQHNRNGTAMGCFSAEKKAQRLRVCEYIADTKGHTWTDVSSWYWHTVLGDARGGWWSFVVAERAAAGKNPEGFFRLPPGESRDLLLILIEVAWVELLFEPPVLKTHSSRSPVKYKTTG